MHVCMYVCMYVCMHACMHACMYACVCIHVCICGCSVIIMGLLVSQSTDQGRNEIFVQTQTG